MFPPWVLYEYLFYFPNYNKNSLFVHWIVVRGTVLRDLFLTCLQLLLGIVSSSKTSNTEYSNLPFRNVSLKWTLQNKIWGAQRRLMKSKCSRMGENMGRYIPLSKLKRTFSWVPRQICLQNFFWVVLWFQFLILLAMPVHFYEKYLSPTLYWFVLVFQRFS